MTPSKVLIACAAVVTLLLGACGGSNDQAPTASPSAGTQASTSPAPGGSSSASGKKGHNGSGKNVSVPGTTQGSPPVPGGPGPGASPTPPSQSSGGSTPAPDQAGVTATIAPREDGTYRYDTDGQTSYGGGFTSPAPPETTLKVDPANGARQRSVRDMRDSQGNGSVTETWLEFRSDGAYLDRVRTTTTFGPTSDVRDLRPDHPALVAKRGVGPGWHVAFTMTGSGTTARVEIDVIRRERVTIDGRAVDTFLTRTRTTFSGDLRGTSTSETWYTPDHLLPVKEHSVTDAQTSAGSFHSEQRSTLQHLSPE